MYNCSVVDNLGSIIKIFIVNFKVIFQNIQDSLCCGGLSLHYAVDNGIICLSVCQVGKIFWEELHIFPTGW